MPDLHYENPELAELYDVFSGWSKDRDFYLSLAGDEPLRILDVGCGTGLLCNALAGIGHSVTGVDPAAAMLDLARQQPRGDGIEWIEATAQDFSTASRFDLAIMTGHAFQVLLSDDEVSSALRNVHRHLAAGGRFVFESRNPAVDWRSRWNHDRSRMIGGQEVREVSRLIGFQGDRLRFELRYEFAGRTEIVPSELRFLSWREIEARLTEAGLRAGRIMGDWNGGPFNELGSLEIIIEARRAG